MSGQPPQDRPPPPPHGGPPSGPSWSPPGGPPSGPPGGQRPPQGPPGGPPPSPGAWPGPPGAGPPPVPGAPPSGPWGAPPAGGYGYGGYGGPGGGYAQPKAGWGIRLVALLIDSLIVGLLSLPAVLMLITGPKHEELCRVDSEGTIEFGDTGPDNAICEVPDGSTIAISVVLGIAGGVASIAYFSIMDGKKGATLGKQAMGIRVVDANSGQLIGTGRGVGRHFARILSALPCGLGYLWPLWDDQQQTFHDKIVNTVVVKT